jgi:hypothetical protein
MYKAGLSALTLITALTAGSLVAGAQSYSREVKLPGITGLISHDAVPEGFDPISAADSQLEEYGFPPRPDSGDSKAYARWQQAVSLPRIQGQYVNTGRFHRPNHSTGPIATNSKDNISSSGSYNWSGYAITGGSPALTKVEGLWVVPSVNNQYESFTGYMSEWVGIDGDCTCDDLIQDGTEQDWTGGKPGYYAWIEFIPEAELEISNFPVSPGDVVEMYAWETESGGVVKGNYYLANFNTKVAGSTSLKIPPNTKFSGKSAEWIVERTEVNGSFENPLPFYAFAYMDNAFAFRGTSTKTIDYSKEATQNIYMVQSPTSSTHLSKAYEQDADSLWFEWLAY